MFLSFLPRGGGGVSTRIFSLSRRVLTTIVSTWVLREGHLFILTPRYPLSMFSTLQSIWDLFGNSNRQLSVIWNHNINGISLSLHTNFVILIHFVCGQYFTMNWWDFFFYTVLSGTLVKKQTNECRIWRKISIPF